MKKYVLSKRINRGGMAEIFLGRFHGTDGFAKVVCIKRILPHFASDESFVEMFRDEAHICKRLQHANIVQVFDFEKVDGSYALVMEFVNGADLRTALAACERAKVRIPLSCALYTVAMAARGLHYAHTRKDDITGLALGIVHRDISPQNLLLGYGGAVKVTDFGIADAESKITDTKPGVVKGKFAYMAPEQIMGKSVDARTDVFALGVVLWEMLAMRRLFAGNTEVETIKNVQAVKIQQDIRKINPGIPEEVVKVLFKALEKDPKRRYQSAQEFEKGLLSSLYKAKPDFTTSDFGTFLSQLLADRKAVSLDEIKKIMTESHNIPSEVEDSENLDIATEQPIDIKAEKEIEIELSLDAGQSQKKNYSAQNQLRKASGYSNPSPVQVNIPNYQQPRSAEPYVAQQHFKSKKAQAALANFKQSRKSSSVLSYILGAMVILASIGGGVWAYQKYMLNTENTLRISSSTTPLQVFLNGTPYKNGDYLDSPIRLELPEGANRVEIRRDGYLPVAFEKRSPLASSEQDMQVNMQLDKSIARSNVSIVAEPGMLNPWVSINRGFISQGLPLKTSQMRRGVRYNITVFPQYPRTDNAFACSFTPQSLNPLRPSQLSVGRQGGRASCRLITP